MASIQNAPKDFLELKRSLEFGTKDFEIGQQLALQLIYHDMDTRRSAKPDFEAKITILSETEGGRSTPPHNWIRWDFAYRGEDISEELFMIWPYFVGLDGLPVPKDQPLVGTYHARMFICVRDMVEFHETRISKGLDFNCHEGRRVVATGVVTNSFL